MPARKHVLAIGGKPLRIGHADKCAEGHTKDGARFGLNRAPRKGRMAARDGGVLSVGTGMRWERVYY